MTAVPTSNGRIASVDGMRAIAIGLVLCAHALGTGAASTRLLSHVCADLGVRAFFVLSGFLITTLLLHEDAERGKISLKIFYLRRALRLFPAVYVFLVVVAILRLLRVVNASGSDLLYASTYMMNFHAARAWSVGHLWSLAVEEQFYLAWPLTLLILGVRRTAIVAIAAIAAAPIIRVWAWYQWPEVRGLTDQAFPCVVDTLATGCLLAISREWLEKSPRYRALLDAKWFWAASFTCVASIACLRPWFSLGVSMTFANLGIVLMIHRCVLRPTTRLVAVLERPILVRVGVLSYSLYLWQQLFVNRHVHTWVTSFPLNIVLSFAAAAFSYRLVEKPFLRISRRLSVRRERPIYLLPAPISLPIPLPAVGW